MNEFLNWLMEPSTTAEYATANQRCAAWARETNQALLDSSLPVRVMQLGTIWTVLFKEPGRYNWLLQYYLRAQGITLSWVGTGRCMTSLDFTEQDYRNLQSRLVSAVHQMKSDAWWLNEQQQPQRDKLMRRYLFRELAGSIVRVPEPVTRFYTEIMHRKHDDHLASHSNPVNQVLHLLSSTTFIFCYVLVFFDLTRAVCLGLAALFVRQFGHAVLEPPCHDKEQLLLGFNTRDKTIIVAGYGLILAAVLLKLRARSLAAVVGAAPTLAHWWFFMTLAVVFGHVVFLAWKHNLRNSLVWFVKLVTDPFTDIAAYYGSPYRIVANPQTHKRELA